LEHAGLDNLIVVAEVSYRFSKGEEC